MRFGAIQNNPNYSKHLAGGFANVPAANLLTPAMLTNIVNAGGLASGNTGFVYDSITWKQGTAFPTQERALFQIPLDQPDTEVGGTTTFKKTLLHTNMTDVGKLPIDTAFYYNRLMVHVTAVENQPTFNTAQDTDGQPSTTDGQGAAFSAPSTIIQSLQNNLILRFSVQSKVLFAGPCLFYPSDFGISGHAGVLGTSGTNGVSDGAANNGFGRSYPLEGNWLDALRPFKATFQMIQAQTAPTSNWLRIYVILAGKGWGPLIG